MIVLAIAAAMTLGMQDEPKSLREQIGAPHDASNGFFDYVDAAEIVLAADFSALEREYTELLNQKVKAKGRNERLAELRQRMARVAEQAMVQVRIGNQKQVWDPRTKVDVTTLFPELTNFRSVARAGKYAIVNRLSQGDSRGAARLVADGLSFSQHIASGPLISLLVGLAADSIYLAVIEPYLMSFSEADLRVLSEAATAYLARPPMFRRVAEAETRFYREMFESWKDQGREDVEVEEADQTTEYLKNLTPERIEKMAVQIMRRMTIEDEKELKILESSEANWYTKIRLTDTLAEDFAEKEEPPPKNDQDVVDQLLRLRSSLFIMVEPVGIRRAQVRLLLLHTKILQYRWSYDRLPNTLAEVDTSIDPLSGKPFRYEVNGMNYRLWSEGRGPRGEVELRYRRPKSAGTTVGDGPP
jgi:hypothetical protein